VLLLTIDSPELSQAGSQPVILVVEDEVLVRNFVCLQLQRDGYQVLAAADGVEALQVARAYTGTIHMLLTDVIMPRMDGPGARASDVGRTARYEDFGYVRQSCQRRAGTNDRSAVHTEAIRG
jgi:hypothetical protein